MRFAHIALLWPPEALPDAVQCSRTAPSGAPSHDGPEQPCVHRFQCGGSPAVVALNRAPHGALPRSVARPVGLDGRSPPVRLCATFDRTGRASRVTLLPVARGRRDARPERRTKNWNLTPQSSRPHRSVQRRSNLLRSPQMTSPRSGRTRGNVSRLPRQTTGRKPVRTAPRFGSTWAPSSSSARSPRRSSMSFVIGTTRGCAVAATSSSPRAQRSSVGTAANDARVRVFERNPFGNVRRTTPSQAAPRCADPKTINLCRRCYG